MAYFNRTLLDAVQRIIVAIGEDPPVALANPTVRVRQAINAVNDAVSQVWTEGKWHFRLKWAPFDLVADNPRYLMPENFHEAAEDFAVLGEPRGLVYRSLSELQERHPEAAFVVGSVGGDTNTETNVSPLSLAAAADTIPSGAPSEYTFIGSYLHLYPAPSAEWLDSLPSKEKLVLVPYFALPLEVDGDNQVIPITGELLTAHHYLALAFLKQNIEAADFQADEARGMRALQTVLSKRVRRGLADARFRPRAV